MHLFSNIAIEAIGGKKESTTQFFLRKCWWIVSLSAIEEVGRLANLCRTRPAYLPFASERNLASQISVSGCFKDPEWILADKYIRPHQLLLTICKGLNKRQISVSNPDPA
jgi:hypothetical protein